MLGGKQLCLPEPSEWDASSKASEFALPSLCDFSLVRKKVAEVPRKGTRRDYTLKWKEA